MTENKETQMGCCGRFMAELRLGMWSPTDVNGKTIDFEQSFRPQPRLVGLFFKLGFTAWTLQFIIHNFIIYDDQRFWIAYLSNASALLSAIYHLLSFVRAIVPLNQANPVSFFTRFLWGFFACMTTVELLVTILYWTLEYEGQAVDYVNMMKHLVLLITLWIDGIGMNRTPLRLKQMMWPLLYAAMYLLWLGIHSMTDIGNPRKMDNDPETDDDAIYAALNWNARPTAAAILTVLVMVAIVPVLFMITWILSLFGRRYVEDGQQGIVVEKDDEEEGVEQGVTAYVY